MYNNAIMTVRVVEKLGTIYYGNSSVQYKFIVQFSQLRPKFFYDTLLMVIWTKQYDLDYKENDCLLVGGNLTFDELIYVDPSFKHLPEPSGIFFPLLTVWDIF